MSEEIVSNVPSGAIEQLCNVIEAAASAGKTPAQTAEIDRHITIFIS